LDDAYTSTTGQTMGDQFNSDGRMKGELQTETIQCDAAAGSCAINVKAPSIVLVFLNDQTLADSTPPNEGPQTFATTAATVRFSLGYYFMSLSLTWSTENP
jgi:hypothetical protein